jgi:hypothetical protein
LSGTEEKRQEKLEPARLPAVLSGTLKSIVQTYGEWVMRAPLTEGEENAEPYPNGTRKKIAFSMSTKTDAVKPVQSF